MRSVSKWLSARKMLAAGVSAAVAGAALVMPVVPAAAHGSAADPASRVYNCQFLNPSDPMCVTARQANPQALYDWMEVNIGNAAGRHRELIPDGRLCSANRDKYAAFDTPDTRWRATPLKPDPDGKYTFRWESSAPHATAYYRLFLTKPGFDVTKPLAWNDLELVHDTGALPAEKLTTIRTNLPQRSGRHILYTIWQRSDSPEAFYSCSDVSFGSGGTSPSPSPTGTATPSPTPTVTPTPTPSTTPGTNARVSYRITSDWVTGYCVDGTVTTDSRTPVPWTVPFAGADTVTSLWNGQMNGASPQRTVSGALWNPTVVAGTPVVFGLCANRSAAPPNPSPTTTASPSPSPTRTTATPTPTPTTASPSPTATTASPRPTVTTASPSPTRTTTSPSPTATISPTPAPTGSPTVTTATTVTSNWGTGYCADVRVSTTSAAPVTWSVPFAPSGTLQNVWSAKLTTTGGQQRASGETWNATVSAAAPTVFGFCATGIPGAGPSATPSPTASPTTVSPSPSTASPSPTRTPTPTPTPTVSTSPTASPSPTSTATASPTPSPTATSAGGPRRVGYFTAWGIYQRGYLVKNLVTSGSAQRLTHINYAFGNIGANGECSMVNQTGEGDAWADYGRSFSAAESVDGVADRWDQPLRGNFNQLKELKAQYPNVRALISLGGWTWSKRFSDVALTDASRQKFVRSCIDLYLRGNLPSFDGAGGTGAAAGVFDGIDIDWEYPASPGLEGNVVRPEDTRNFTLLLAEFRRQLDTLTAQTGKRYDLTAAVPADPTKIAKIEVDQVARTLDFINIMSYDFRGAWDAKGPTNFHSNLYPDPNSPGDANTKTFAVTTAVDAWRKGGAPAKKLVVGVPFYGRGWTGVTGGGNGLYQPAAQAAPATYEAGYEDFKVLRNLPGYTSYRDPITKQSWIFNGSTFWSFDTPAVLADKAAYIKANDLGGAMIWSMDGDTADGELMKALDNALK